MVVDGKLVTGMTSSEHFETPLAPGQQLFPDGIQMDDSAANVEIFEKETLYTVGHYFNSLS